jgi:hypothetical protein
MAPETEIPRRPCFDRDTRTEKAPINMALDRFPWRRAEYNRLHAYSVGGTGDDFGDCSDLAVTSGASGEDAARAVIKGARGGCALDRVPESRFSDDQTGQLTRDDFYEIRAIISCFIFLNRCRFSPGTLFYRLLKILYKTNFCKLKPIQPSQHIFYNDIITF